MAEQTVLSVIIGLAVGIMLILLFAFLFSSSTSPDNHRLNSALSNAPNSSSSDQNGYAKLIVLRLGNSTEILPSQFTIYTLENSDSVLLRHRELKTGIQSEDTRINNYTTYCKSISIDCRGLQFKPYTHPYSTSLDHSTVRLILDDPELHFFNSPSLPSSFKEMHLEINGIIYSVGLQCTVENCK